jgi:hypothetical protein
MAVAVAACLMLVSLVVPAQVAPQDGTPVTPVGATAQAGPWELVVGEVQTGEAAATAIVDASPGNPAALEGTAYSLVEVTATNVSDAPQRFETGDFLLLGADWAGQRGDLVAPDPALTGTVEPGATLTGYVALAGPDTSPPTILGYDSLTLDGDWADALFALVDGAALPTGEGEATDAGSTVDAAVATGEPVTTGDWSVTVEEVVVGDGVYDLYPASDYRTTALGRFQAGDLSDTDGDGAAGWVAVRVGVTYTGPETAGAFLSSDAFTLAQQDGTAVPNGLFLTAPEPAAEGWYVPGEARKGWLVFEIQVAWDSDAMRFQANRLDGEPRYLLIY